jgi:hypothetical protein
LDRVQALATRARDAWAAFGQRVNTALDGEFEEEVLVPVRVKRAVAGRFHAEAGAWGDVVGTFANLGVPPTAFDPASGAALPRADGPRNLKTFPSPPGLRWEEVTLQFVSDTALRVRARDASEVYTFAEIGFKDGRSAERPDKLWLLLRVFARENGALTWRRSSGLVKDIGLTSAAVKTAVKELRKRLRAVLGIEADPFYPYRKVGAYKVKFALLDHDNCAPARPDEDDA